MPIIAQDEARSKRGDIPPPREGILARIPDGAITVAVVILASAGSFGLGVLAGRDMDLDDTPVRIEGAPEVKGESASASTETETALSSAPQKPTPVLSGAGQYVASKKGTKYHLPWCPGAKAMSEENKIWFATREAAEAAGYTPAANCKGI